MKVRYRTATRSHNQPQALWKLPRVLAKGFANESLPTVSLRRIANFLRYAQSKLSVSKRTTNGMNDQHTIAGYLARFEYGSKVRLAFESCGGRESRGVRFGWQCRRRSGFGIERGGHGGYQIIFPRSLPE